MLLGGGDGCPNPGEPGDLLLTNLNGKLHTDRNTADFSSIW